MAYKVICKFSLFLLLFGIASAHPHAENSRQHHPVESFLGSLNQDQLNLVIHEIHDPERLNWHYVPRERAGLPIKSLQEDQEKAHVELLSKLLSESGIEKVSAIIQLERILGELTDNIQFRDPGKYYVSGFFPDSHPSYVGPWGWRLEGHHLSLNFLLTGDQIVASTPAFWGANPARVPRGPDVGKRALAQEEDLGRALVKSFSSDQLGVALLADRAPRDILTGADRSVRISELEGLAVSAMSVAQQSALRDLIDVYLNSFSRVWAETMRADMEAGNWEHVHFAWAGGLKPGEGHYYRIHGPTIFIEYDNTQNGANHIHAVVRDPRGDFGIDLLREHYENAH